MSFDNALIIGSATETNATGTVNRVCPGEYCDVMRLEECKGDKIFISSLLKDEDLLYECVDYCIENKPEVIVCAGDDLYDSGVLEARYRLSPIMFLHKIGLLNEKCRVVGGICFDRDDADLMAMTGSKLVVCPSYSCGTGRGIPLVTPALGKVKIELGTYDNSYNTDGDILLEAKILLLGTCSAMRKSEAVTVADLASMAGERDVAAFAKLLKTKLK